MISTWRGPKTWQSIPNSANRRLSLAIVLSISMCGLAAQEAEPSFEEIYVTGTRIQESGMTTPTPVTAVTVEELAIMAPGALIEGMSQLPQFFGNTSTANPGNFFSTPGSGNLNLRGLNTNRTLILLDGRRIVSSTKYGGTDINILPEAMLKGVETVTGGASAAYGTDAVAGVVNFLLDTEYTGTRGHLQGGIASRGDNENWEGSIAVGRDLGEQAHILFSAEHARGDGIYSYDDREWYRSWGLITNTSANVAAGAPARLVRPDVVSTGLSLDGIIWAPGTAIHQLEFHPDGSYSPFVFGSDVGTNPAHSISNGGSGADNGAERPFFIPETERDSLFGYADYDLTDNINVYAQGIYGRGYTRQNNVGGAFNPISGQVNAPITIFRDNAFLPAALNQIMIDNNIASFQLGRIGSNEDLGANTFTVTDSKTWSITGGFKVDIDTDGYFDGWTMNGYYQYGHTFTLGSQQGPIRLDRIYLAVDAVNSGGQIRCRVTVISGLYPDCQPLNLFGRGNASPEAIDWVKGYDTGYQVNTPVYYSDSGYDSGETISYAARPHKENEATLEQHVVELNVSGEVWEGWGAGPVSLALGGHYREEHINQLVYVSQGNTAADPNVRPVPADDATLGIRGVAANSRRAPGEVQFSTVPNVRGEMSSTEAYSEILVPLLHDLPFIQQLNFNAAGRWTDYSSSGEMWAYKFGVDWTVMDEFRLRGTYSRDVRAATLSERLDQTGGAGNVDWIVANPAPPPATLIQRFGITTRNGGNPDVAPESSDTMTVGAVYQPNWLDGLQVSVDWYDVSLQDAIAILPLQTIVDDCQGGQPGMTGDQVLCRLIILDPTSSFPVRVDGVYINLNEAKVSGVDAEIAYRADVDWFGGGESIRTRAFVTWLEESSRTNRGAGGAFIKVDNTGQTGSGLNLPEWKFTANAAYTRGPFDLFIQGRYIDGGTLNSTWEEGVNVDDNSVDSAFYVDLRASYSLQLAGGEWQVFANATNLLDKDPPITAGYTGLFGSSAQYNSALFDLLGRRFTVGVNFNF